MTAIGSGQQNLLWTNGFLTLVNGIGIWRWLGRQAKYEDGGQHATKRSAAARVPTLFAVGAMTGAKLIGRDEESIGVVIEGMMRCDDAGLAYFVVSEGGVGGVGERLHALHPNELTVSEDGVRCALSAEDLRTRPVLEPDRWPAALEGADTTAKRGSTDWQDPEQDEPRS
jgi:hypothetical protein